MIGASGSWTPSKLFAQQLTGRTGESPASAEAGPGVVIERVALRLISPDAYRLRLKLDAVRAVTLVAPTDASVQSVLVQPGATVAQQTEVLRLDSQEAALGLKIAQSEHELAKHYERLAAEGVEDANVRQLQLETARRRLELAQYRVDRTILRAPLAGLVTDMQVTPGQYVRTGTLLARIVDPTQLVVHVPVERIGFDPAAPFSLTIEDQTASAKVEALLPPLPEFDPLRDLYRSLATARVLIDNSDGKFSVGQTVFSPLVPSHPLAEVQIAAVRTAPNGDGERMVQVLREGYVRNIPIQPLGQVGQAHVYVSGRFAAGDELIVSSSQELQDGAWVRPMVREDLQSPAGDASTPSGALPRRMEAPRR